MKKKQVMKKGGMAKETWRWTYEKTWASRNGGFT